MFAQIGRARRPTGLVVLVILVLLLLAAWILHASGTIDLWADLAAQAVVAVQAATPAP